MKKLPCDFGPEPLHFVPVRARKTVAAEVLWHVRIASRWSQFLPVYRFHMARVEELRACPSLRRISKSN